jgi:cold shock CspA family protein
MRGEMVWFNEAKEHGFITTEDGERLYVHESGFVPGAAPVGRCGGRPVTFERVEDETGIRAVGVSFVDEADARRARPRRNQNSVRS